MVRTNSAFDGTCTPRTREVTNSRSGNATVNSAMNVDTSHKRLSRSVKRSVRSSRTTHPMNASKTAAPKMRR